MRIAVIGSGISGLAACWYAHARGFDVTVFERHPSPGLSIHRDTIETPDGQGRVDLPLRVFKRSLWRELGELADALGVETIDVEIPASYSDARGHTLLRTENLALGHLRLPIVRPRHLNRTTASLLWGVVKLQRVLRAPAPEAMTCREYLRRSGLSKRFIEVCLLPLLTLACSCSTRGVLGQPAAGIHALLVAMFDATRRLQRFRDGTDAIARRLVTRASRVHFGAAIERAEVRDGVAHVIDEDGQRATFDHVILATQADHAAEVISDSTAREALRRFEYEESHLVVHDDVTWMPAERRDWSAVNYCLGAPDETPAATLWLNRLEPSLSNAPPLFQTWSPERPPPPERCRLEVRFQRPVPTLDSDRALADLIELERQPDRKLWCCGSYADFGVPLLETGVRSARRVIEAIARQTRPGA